MANTVSRSLINLSDQLGSLLRERLWLQVLAGMVLGVITGILIGPTVGLLPERMSLLIADWVALPGQLFLLAIQFVVIPLVVASVIRGICAGQGSSGLGKLSGCTVAFFCRHHDCGSIDRHRHRAIAPTATGEVGILIFQTTRAIKNYEGH